MNKKGFLLGEFTLKIIISILGILLLVFLLFSLYKTLSERNDYEKASSVLERITTIADSLADNSEIRGPPLEPRGWVVLFFMPSINSPGKCSGQSCLCICSDESAEICDASEKGVCKQTSYEYAFNSDGEPRNIINIKNPNLIDLKREVNKIIIYYDE